VLPVETIPGMQGGEIKESGGAGEFKYDIFCKCHNVPQHNSKNK
jgi:hypothetical protein